jgi:hypothetical protein
MLRIERGFSDCESRGNCGCNSALLGWSAFSSAASEDSTEALRLDLRSSGGVCAVASGRRGGVTEPGDEVERGDDSTEHEGECWSGRECGRPNGPEFERIKSPREAGTVRVP